MRKVLFFLLLPLFFIFPRNIFAGDQFLTSSYVRYEVGENGKTKVIQDFTIENLQTDVYAATYSLILEGVKPINPHAFSGNANIPLQTTTDNGRTNIKINFPNAVVGKGQRRSFTLTFEDTTLATKTGEVWEITIPKLNESNSFDNYSASLSVPQSFGLPAYISPNPGSKHTEESGRNVFVFGKETLSKSGVTAAFGQFQVFSFNLTYHLENPLNVGSSVEIAIPPDTAYQKVNYKSITPVPENVIVDEDGNWLAKFNLKARQRIDVNLQGSVQIFAHARAFPMPPQSQINNSLNSTDLWQTGDPQIQAIAKNLKTPRAIYDYVVNTLTYDYSRVKPNVERFGAVGALANPQSAICTEFTDLFIALSRAAGIPAREINGYAYTENPEIEPLSLVSDVLHAWPEYWDAKLKVWVPVDPTWGATTGSIDYFDKLDLRHFTFVIHGKDSKKPYPPGSYKLGPNPQKDVFVSFGQLEPVKVAAPAPALVVTRELPLLDMKVKAIVRNTTPNSLYNETVTIAFDGKTISEYTIVSLPPYGVYEVPLTVPFSFLGQNTPSTITLRVSDEVVEIHTYRIAVIITSLALILALILGLMLVVYARFTHRKIKDIFKRRP